MTQGNKESLYPQGNLHPQRLQVRNSLIVIACHLATIGNPKVLTSVGGIMSVQESLDTSRTHPKDDGTSCAIDHELQQLTDRTLRLQAELQEQRQRLFRYWYRNGPNSVKWYLLYSQADVETLFSVDVPTISTVVIGVLRRGEIVDNYTSTAWTKATPQGWPSGIRVCPQGATLCSQGTMHRFDGVPSLVSRQSPVGKAPKKRQKRAAKGNTA